MPFEFLRSTHATAWACLICTSGYEGAWLVDVVRAVAAPSLLLLLALGVLRALECHRVAVSAEQRDIVLWST